VPVDLRGVTVMVVEDHEDSREFLVQAVGSFGARVLPAADGAEALMTAWDERPDLVLADLSMPHLDGYEFLRRLRMHPDTRTTPVLAVSGHGSDEDIRRTFEAGFSGHLVKPVDFEVIAAQLARAFRDRVAPEPEAAAAGRDRS
jgi:CheY-like chemotaxis protein